MRGVNSDMSKRKRKKVASFSKGSLFAAHLHGPNIFLPLYLHLAKVPQKAALLYSATARRTNKSGTSILNKDI